jgi:hypothetical protein
MIQDRHWPIQAGGVHKLRLVVVEQMVDVYVDDILVINRWVPELRPGSIGLTARGGTATFKEVSDAMDLISSKAGKASKE